MNPFEIFKDSTTVVLMSIFFMMFLSMSSFMIYKIIQVRKDQKVQDEEFRNMIIRVFDKIRKQPVQLKIPFKY